MKRRFEDTDTTYVKHLGPYPSRQDSRLSTPEFSGITVHEAWIRTNSIGNRALTEQSKPVEDQSGTIKQTLAFSGLIVVYIVQPYNSPGYVQDSEIMSSN